MGCAPCLPCFILSFKISGARSCPGMSLSMHLTGWLNSLSLISLSNTAKCSQAFSLRLKCFMFNVQWRLSEPVVVFFFFWPRCVKTILCCPFASPFTSRSAATNGSLSSLLSITAYGDDGYVSKDSCLSLQRASMTPVQSLLSPSPCFHGLQSQYPSQTVSDIRARLQEKNKIGTLCDELHRLVQI